MVDGAMSEFSFTVEQARKYYETRMGREIRKSGSGYVAKCPFHDDRSPSMSFNFEKGVWRCHTENIGGGMVDFERKLNGTTAEAAMAAIKEIIGIPQSSFVYTGNKPEAIYEYRDEQGRLLFQVVRSRNPQTGKKTISNRRPLGTNNWEYTVEGTRRVLYHLGEVLRATEVFVVEGEKCADAVRKAYCDLKGESDACIVDGFTATTNPHGAGKWREEFAPFFAGKKVIVVPDNDATGRAHMQTVAASVSRFALGVKWLELPLANEKDDIADYLTTHTFADLQTLVRTAKIWQRVDDNRMFVPASDFIRDVPAQIDWRIERVIEKGTSGFIIALPKSGKSFATVAMAAALASGSDWLDCRVGEPTRVALVSREDAPGLTARRLKRAMAGMGKSPDDPIWQSNLLINTRDQSKNLMIDDDQQLAELIVAMQEKQIEFCILDVLNVLHDADENDNSEMRRVLTRVSQIRKEVGCQVCIVHHSVKDWDETKTLSQLARGSSAISGFAEFIVGIRMIDEGTQTRQMRFETKSSEPSQPFYWRIRDLPLSGGVVLERTDYEAPQKRRNAGQQGFEDVFGASA
jgi:hypothetical protein